MFDFPVDFPVSRENWPRSEVQTGLRTPPGSPGFSQCDETTDRLTLKIPQFCALFEVALIVMPPAETALSSKLARNCPESPTPHFLASLWMVWCAVGAAL